MANGFLNSLSEWFHGTPAGVQQIQTPRYNPQQEQILNQLLSMGMGGLQNPTKGFEPIENKARNSFASDTVPGLAERFTATGGGGTSLGSSGFQGAIGAAGSGLEDSLAALKAQYGQGQQQHFSNLLNMGLQPRQDTNAYQTQATQGAWGSTFLPALGQLGLGAASAGITGGWGAVGPALAAVMQLLSPGQGQNQNQNQQAPRL